jgi:hypothetical protein
VLVRELIAIRVVAILKEDFAFDSLAYTLLFDKYWVWFTITYSDMDFFHGYNYSFRGMAEAAFAYIEWCVSRIDFRAVPLTVAVTPERANSE